MKPSTSVIPYQPCLSGGLPGIFNGIGGRSQMGMLNRGVSTTFDLGHGLWMELMEVDLDMNSGRQRFY